MNRGELAVAILLLTLIPLTGCEQKTTVSGAVTYNGQPVEKGSIAFRPSGAGGRSFGAPIDNGRYEAKEAQAGEWTAVVVGIKKINFAKSSDEAARKAAETKAAGGHLAGHVTEAADYIPEDAEGNSKTVDIASGSQTIDFVITGPPRE